MSRDNLSHVVIKDVARSERYTSAKSVRGKLVLKTRQRRDHAEKLREELERAIAEAQSAMHGVAAASRMEDGLLLQVASEYGFELSLDSLDRRTDGIDLVNVRSEISTLGNGEKVTRQVAVLFVPWGKLVRLKGLIENYRDKETKKGNPKNQPLIDSIEDIRRAALHAMWTDEEVDLPEPELERWWEFWLRFGTNELQNQELISAFKRHAVELGVRLQESVLTFHERTVLLGRGTRSQFENSFLFLNYLAELRGAKYTAEDFTVMDSREQAEWVSDAASRISVPPENSPSVCLLDTGINAHPLLVPAMADSDLAAYNPAWGKRDDKRHGTAMAGLCLHGDLVELLVDSRPIALTHRLESVKILPPTGDNDPMLYGVITKHSVAIAETNAPERLRVVCMTVAATDERDRGRPSSWSSALDQITSGSDEEDRVKRLMIVAVGNTPRHMWAYYPDTNATEGVHDPAQSWNSISVGAYTEKVLLDPTVWPNWKPLAQRGGLSPCSSTSLTWEKQWPYKPDIVMEGGNAAVQGELASGDTLDPLQLLTTGARIHSKLLDAFGDTSAATALASRMAAVIWSRYAGFWPETVRALLVHSAEWTSAMLGGRKKWDVDRTELEKILQIYGYGVPSMQDALYSARNALTLISQETLKPFFKEKGDVKTRDWHFYELPWPKAVLQSLGDVEVELRVTLSYFVEPNPTNRGRSNKFRYASHGLRFEMKTPTDSLPEFKKRINKIVREDGEGSTPSDASRWLLGPQKRVRGSIHSDCWRGTAADLAEKDSLAVFPIKGWWSERPHLKKWNESARYSLIVTIRTPETGVDIYSPIANLITT